MSAQTTYNFLMNYGCAGGIVDLAPHEIDTFINEEATGTLLPGRAVCPGTVAGKDVKLPAATSAKIEGVVVNNRTTEYDREGALVVRKNDAVGVMRYGRIYVALDENVTPAFGDAAYVVCTGTKKGLFTTSNSGTVAMNARFVSAAKNGIAMVELQQPNVI